MPHVAAVAEVTVDNPHAEGIITAFAREFDFKFKAAKRDDETYGGVAGQFNIYTGTEWLDALHCLKPKPTLPAGDMTGKWVVEHGDWRTNQPAVFSPRATFADFFASGPGEYGQLLSVDDYGYNIGLGIIRDALPENTEDYPRYVGIEFLSNPTQATFRSTAFIFPFGMKSQPHPYVLDRLATAADGSATVAGHWDLTGGKAYKLDKNTGLEFIMFELIDGRLVVRHSEVDKAFIWEPYGREDTRFHPGAFSPGKMRLIVFGHSASVYCGGLEYDPSSNALAAPYSTLPTIGADFLSGRASWHSHTWMGTGVGGVWNVSTDIVSNPSNGNQVAPRTSFSWSGVGNAPDCPASYVTTLQVEATQAAGTSSPDVLTGQKVVKSLDYSINLKGRGQTATVVVDDPTGAKALAWKGQNLTVIKCGWNDLTPVQKFKGYLGEKPEITRASGDTVGRTSYKLDLQDPVDARLTAKFMVERSAAGFMYLGEWVYWTLFNAGVPHSQLTYIDAIVKNTPIEGFMYGVLFDVLLPGSHGAKDLLFDFEPTVSVPDALDKVTHSMGWEWGWNGELGQFFLRPTWAYVPPADFTLDSATTTADEFAWDIDHIRSRHEFRNYLYMIAQTTGGVDVPEFIADSNSHLLSTASNFIGCDLWEVIKETDLFSARAKAQAKWKELQQQPSVLKWTMRGKPTIGPGKHIKAQVTLMGVATDSIYRITEEKGTMPGEPSLNYKQTFTAEYLQAAPVVP